jgi:hypothetical protein
VKKKHWEKDMAKLLQISFPFRGPFGKQLAETLSGLAHLINEEPGLVWKIWTENEEAQEAGGIYLFEDGENASAYLEMHSERLKGLGITEISAKIFDVNIDLSHITRGPC